MYKIDYKAAKKTDFEQFIAGHSHRRNRKLETTGMVIHWQLKFDHSIQWYMHKLEPVLENETHKILCDFEIKTDHLILSRKPDPVLFNDRKRDYHFVDFVVGADHKVKIKVSEKIDKYLVFTRELKKRGTWRRYQLEFVHLETPHPKACNHQWKSEKEVRPSRTHYC